jgi:aldehyde dehydrogenase (NAD+)
MSDFPSTSDIATTTLRALEAMGVSPDALTGDAPVRTPITGEVIAHTARHGSGHVDQAIGGAADAFLAWREVPAPVRGTLVKRWGQLLTEHKEDLATVVTAEVGKIRSEALGEVQEAIDIADLAVGQSRQLFGRTFPSERPGHRLAENWHPLGVVGIITAFNFPVAVHAWNTTLALVVGDTIVWKPAGAGRLSALGSSALLERARGHPPARAHRPDRRPAAHRGPACATGVRHRIGTHGA